MPLLSVEKLTKSFGGLTAVSSVTMHIDKGELVGLIGPNGAGKTTLFNLLTGVYEPTSGSIKLHLPQEEQDKDGKVKTKVITKELGGLKPYNVTKAGLARTFQNIRLFKDLTVLDNVRIAMHQNIRYRLPSAFLHLNKFHNEEDRLVEEAEKLLDIFKLSHKKEELAKNLPYGEQRHLEIARALATKPVILLLDEPAAGMNPNETAELTETIEWIRKEFDLTILLIEHDMSLVMKICERIYVLDYGMLIASGKPAEIRTNKRVIEAYLGEEVSNA
ncbi:MAG: ABC transporter ATP-binding protein [Clostridia bacterium]|jgi:branched-chain amino acid transport system ATP-binding protein|nr:ABC transporter ATP-binding protein [Clostridia bacterium]